MEVDIVDGGNYGPSYDDSNKLQFLSKHGMIGIVALTTVTIQPAAVVNVFRKPRELRLSAPPMVALVDIKEM